MVFDSTLLFNYNQSMRKYWTIFWVNWQKSLQYRGPTLIYIAGNILYISVLLYLWNAIYREGGQLGSYSLSDLVTYYILQLMINGMVLSYVSWEIVDQIREGFFSNFLVKPVNYLHYWFTINLSGKLIEGVFVLLAGLVMSFLLISYISLPVQGITVVYFLISLSLGLVLAFEFDFFVGLLAFWFIRANAFKYMLQYIMFFFAGALLPLDLFPETLQFVADALPFQYLVFSPIQIFLEKETNPVSGFFTALTWIAVLYVFLRVLLLRGIKKYEAVGQ